MYPYRHPEIARHRIAELHHQALLDTVAIAIRVPAATGLGLACPPAWPAPRAACSPWTARGPHAGPRPAPDDAPGPYPDPSRPVHEAHAKGPGCMPPTAQNTQICTPAAKNANTPAPMQNGGYLCTGADQPQSLSVIGRLACSVPYRRLGATALMCGRLPGQIHRPSGPGRAQSAMRFRISAGPRATIRSPGANRTWWSGFAATSLPGFFSARMATPA